MYVPAIEIHNIMIYLYKSCHWGERRIRNYKPNIKCIQIALSQSYHRIPDTTKSHTGLSVFNYVCIVICIIIYLFSSPQCKLKTGNHDA